MAAAETTTTGTEAPKGFPPFKSETYPAQLFWLHTLSLRDAYIQ